jgi:hypothetical protein
VSLTFGANTSDRVVIGQATSINSLNAFSVAALIYPTTLTTDKRIASKFAVTDLAGWTIEHKTTDKLSFFVGRDTTNATYTVSTAMTNNEWWQMVCTFDVNATPSIHIYMARVGSALVEPGYGTATDGTGPIENDSAVDLHIGNLSSSSTAAFIGRIASFAMFNRALTLGQAQSLFADPTFGAMPSRVLYQEFGFNGTQIQTDFSGNRNHGTVTGAIVSGHPYRNTYMPQAEEWWQGYDGYGPWPQYRRLGFVAAGVTAYPDHYYRMMRAA